MLPNKWMTFKLLLLYTKPTFMKDENIILAYECIADYQFINLTSEVAGHYMMTVTSMG